MPVVNRATAKTYFETGDKPTELQFSTLLDSTYFKLDDTNLGLNFHTPTIAYLAGNGVIDSGTGSVYYALTDVPIGIALSNTSYWARSAQSLPILLVANIDNPTELNTRGLTDGAVILVKESANPQKGATFYLHHATAAPASSPYILDTNDSGSWYAIAGRNQRGGGVTVVNVANVDNPSTELNALTITNGALLLVRESGTPADGGTLYMHSTTVLTPNAPYVVATGDSGSWVAIAGRYVNSPVRTSEYLSAVKGLLLSMTDTIDITGNTSTPHTPLALGRQYVRVTSGNIRLPAHAPHGYIVIVSGLNNSGYPTPGKYVDKSDDSTNFTRGDGITTAIPVATANGATGFDVFIRAIGSGGLNTWVWLSFAG